MCSRAVSRAEQERNIVRIVGIFWEVEGLDFYSNPQFEQGCYKLDHCRSRCLFFNKFGNVFMKDVGGIEQGELILLPTFQQFTIGAALSTPLCGQHHMVGGHESWGGI